MEWLDSRLNNTLARGREWLTDKSLSTGKPYLPMDTVDEEPDLGGISVIRLKNGDYTFAPSAWNIPDEVLERYRTKQQ